MKSLYRVWAPAMVALLAAVAVYAYPTVMPGPSGAIMLPTADTAVDGQFTLAATGYDTINEATYPVRATFGLSDTWEAGAVYAINNTANIWGVNAKFSEPDSGGRRTAIGALYLAADGVNTTVDQVYIARTHPFFSASNDSQLKGTIGLNWTRIDQTVVENEGVRLYGAIEYINDGNLSFYAEVQSRDPELGDTRNLVSAGIRYPTNKQVLFELGVSNATPLGVQGQTPTRWFAGIGVKTD